MLLFKQYNLMKNKIDYMIKVWWSLIENEEKFNDLNEKLVWLWDKANIIITTWSKNLSDVMMDYIRDVVKFELKWLTRFDLIMKARDSMSKLFADTNEAYLSVETSSELEVALNDWYIPVLAQYNMLKEKSPFQFWKGLSTDTTSAYFAKHFNAEEFIKLTNVDWVYKNFWTEEQELISEIHASDLLKMWKTCIDDKFAQYLLRERMNCKVLNWYNLSNLENFIHWKDSVYTKVYS